jgi:glycosyltransferase involved in cell wall biosynthesis
MELFRLEHALSPPFARWLTDVLRRHRVMLAHSHEFTMAVYGAWAARRAGVAHVITMHGSRYYAGRWRRRVAMHLACRLAGATVAVSQSLAAHLCDDLWLSPSRLTTIPNGARLATVAQSSLRNELGLRDGEQLAVAVGNLYPVKGHIHLVEALGLLAQRFPRFHVAIAGRGELEAPLKAQAEALHVSERLHLLGLRADVGNVLAGADLFVHPSLSEGLPLAIIEAMLAARPIVASAVGELPTVLSEGAGALVPPGDSPALAEMLGRFLADPAAARRAGAAAAHRAQREYTLDRMVERYAALYATLLDSRGPSRPRFRDY